MRSFTTAVIEWPSTAMRRRQPGIRQHLAGQGLRIQNFDATISSAVLLLLKGLLALRGGPQADVSFDQSEAFIS